MAEKMKQGMNPGTNPKTGEETKQVCFNPEDGAWYPEGAVVCNNGHDWACKPTGRWTALGSSKSCKI